jgi:hypothetical protein
VLLVERGEWKDRTIPLHAFIAAQISITHTAGKSVPAVDDNPAPMSARRAGRESGRVAVENDVDISSTTKLPQDSRSTGWSAAPSENASRLKDLRIVRDKDGIAYLFSSNSDVNLPSGTLFLLQDTPVLEPATTETNVKPSAPPASPQK